VVRVAKKSLRSKAAFPRRRLTPAVVTGSRVVIADNSGAKIGKVIGVPEVKTRLRRQPFASVGDLVVITVKKGTPDTVGQIFYGIVIRQKKPYRRPDGTRVAFEDNAVVIVTPEGTPKATEIRGPVAREAAERWSAIANLATMII
jgi:large subunit ribosomal protein L14